MSKFVSFVKMASETCKRIAKEVRPILSFDHHEARIRVVSLYKAWYRQIPYILKNYDLPFSTMQCKKKLREEFTKFDIINDIRVIDMLVIKGQMELKEAVEKWSTRRALARYFRDTIEPKPRNFVAKFLEEK